MLTSPDTHQQSIPVGCHRALGRGSPGWDEVQGEPFSWIHVFPQGRCSLWSLWPLPKRPHIPGWGMCPERGFHPSPTGPGTGAEVGLQWSLPLWLSHTGADMQTAASCGTSLQGQLSLRLSQVPAKEMPGQRARSGHRQHPRSWGQTLHSGWIQEVSMKQECPSPPFLLWLLHPSLLTHLAPKPGCASASLLGTAEGTETPVGMGGAEFGVGGKGPADTSQTPPHPFVLPPSCLLQAQIRDERLMGQIFMKATSSTLAFPKQPPPPLAPNPVAN